MSESSAKNPNSSSNSASSGTQYHDKSVFPPGALPEIEQAFVATLWHHPDLLAETQRWLVPEVHLSSPKLRILLAAIAETYALLSTADWVSVLACISELEQLQECGGREGLDEVYSCRFYEPLFPLYAQELRKAGQARAQGVFLPPTFSGGSGTVFYEERTKRFIGTARIAGKVYRINGKSIEGKIQLNFYPQ